MTNEINHLEAELRRVSRRLDQRESVESLVLRRVEDVLDGFSWSPPHLPRKDKRKLKDRETCVIHISDTQIGKKTPTYDFSIAKDRMKKFVKTVEKIVSNRRNSAKIEQCVILIGGDIVEGETIFSHQPWTVDGDLWEQAIKKAPAILSDFIIEVSSYFRSVHVAAVPGNHGRSAP